MKAFFNKIVAGLLLIIVSPVLLIFILTILLFDQHAPFFCQQRLGVNKKPFIIYKLRSMKNGKVSRIGKVIRKTGIDELPQLLNIFFGQMNFVGPRPLTREDVERLNWTGSYYNKRWKLKPGLVGLAQLSPVCDKKVSWFLDNRYIEKRCLKLNASILMASVLVPLIGKTTLKKWIHKR